MSEELARYGNGEMTIARDPEEILSEATRAAEALTRVIKAKPEKVMINGKQLLEFEDWQLLGKFYGLTAKVVSTKYLDFGTVRGWEAHAVAINRNGAEVSAADGMCLNDEEKWSTRTKYEFVYLLKDGTRSKENPPKNKIIWVDNPKSGGKMPKREKVKVADEPVPFFQLRAMAQTRAARKALQNVLSWVVVLSGYKTTAPDETPPIDSEEPNGKGEPEIQQNANKPILEQQKALILAKLKEKNLALDLLEGFMQKALADFNKYPDVNVALEWIAKRAVEKQ